MHGHRTLFSVGCAAPHLQHTVLLLYLVADHLVVVSQGSTAYIDLIALKAANPGKCCINLGAQTVKSIVSAASYYVSPPNDKECKVKTCPSNPAGVPAQAVYVCGCKGGACCAKYP